MTQVFQNTKKSRRNVFDIFWLDGISLKLKHWSLWPSHTIWF